MAKTPIQIRDLADTVTSLTRDFVDIPLMDVPNTTITNRAQMADLTQDLKVSMGVERIMVNQIYEIQNEFGPNGERIWGVVNDPFGMIRLGGSWAPGVSPQGIFLDHDAAATSTREFVEITFYGTGLNILLGYGQNGNDYTLVVDGGASTTFNAGASSLYDSQNTNPNVIFPVVSGLAQDIHTIKITKQNGNKFTIIGFEILNESTSLHVNPGTALIGGSRNTVANASTLAYNSGFTNTYGTPGTRGAKVLVYLDEDGAVKKDIQYTGSIQKNILNADFDNSEVIRSYHWREFGVGNSTDFATNTEANASTLNYTLDDGTTCLFGGGLATNTGTGALTPATTSSTLAFTFVGTGLAFLRQDQNTSAIDDHDFYIDGVLIGSPSGIYGTSPEIQKVVSDLKFGTHVFVMIRNNNASNGVGIHNFIVYGPKTPALPDGAIALAEYHLLGSYTQSLATEYINLSQGVIRKHCPREFITSNSYVFGDGAYFLGGRRFIASADAAAYFDYTFMGTGFEWRQDTFPADSQIIVMTLNGVTVSTANFTITHNGGPATGTGPAINVDTYGGPVFTPASGNISLDAPSALGTGVAVSGLDFGVYTLKVQNGQASAFMLHALDIITPIYCRATPRYMVMNNMIEIGSNSMNDLRKLSQSLLEYISQAQTAQGVLLTAFTIYYGLGFCPTPISCVYKSNKTRARVKWTLMYSNTTGAGNSVSFTLYMDGRRIPYGANDVASTSTGSNTYMIMAEVDVVGVGPGEHLFRLYANTTPAGTVLMSGKLVVEEI